MNHLPHRRCFYMLHFLLTPIKALIEAFMRGAGAF